MTDTVNRQQRQNKPNRENVDAAEIEKFSELASRWWDSESEFKPLHQINPLRLNYINQRVQGLKGKKVIDIGCGGGILADSMAALGAQVVAIDMAEASLAVAKLHQLESGQKVEYIYATAEAMAEKHPGEFDLVTCLEMLEHVPDPASIINACQKLLKPQGDVFISTINRNAKAFVFAILGAEYLLKLLPKGTHQYEKFIKPSEIANWSRECHLEIKHAIGMHYNPFTKNYRLAPGLDVNYLMHLKNQ